MSYFEFFCSNIKSKNRDIIIGACYQMCPQEEIEMREKETLVHVLEVINSDRKLVKEYSRSAADANMAVPRLLRPFPVLKETLQHLLFVVSKRTDVPMCIVYDFINDRLRAIRQDMTIQRLPPEQCMQLLEPMVRFHVYYGYELCEHTLRDYDSVMNKKCLLECLKLFLSCCDSNPHSDFTELADGFFALDLDNKGKLQTDRVLMESLYILSNLDDVHPLYRYLSLPKSLKCDPCLKLAYKIAVANLKGNYVEVCRMLERLCPLTYCALCLYLPTLQRRALAVINRAYSSKVLTVPLDAIGRWLQLKDVTGACTQCGLRVEGSVLRCGGAGSKDVVLKPKKLPRSSEDKSLSLDHIFTYTTKISK